MLLLLDLDFVDDRDEDADVPNTPNSTVLVETNLLRRLDGRLQFLELYDLPESLLTTM